LKQKREFDGEIERSISPNTSNTSHPGFHALTVTGEKLADATATVTAHPTSSAEYLVTQIKSHKRGAIVVALGVVLIIVSALSYFVFLRKPSVRC